jgi:hypothetical protein
MLRKPSLRVDRVSLLEQEIRTRLSTPALEILMNLAETLSEGQVKGGRYFGSTMLTVDLAGATTLVRDPVDASLAHQVAALLDKDARARARVRATALAAATERAGADLGPCDVEIRTRAAGTTVYVDVDVEGELAAAAGGAR